MLKNRKLDFLVIGAQKAGTSALDYYLRKHPQICLPIRKELHFFDREEYFIKKKPNYDILHKSFECESFTLKSIGEITPIYMFWKPCIERIYNYNPKIKLIAILRNPIERAFSHWNMEKSRNKENKSFEYCIKEEENRVIEKYSLQDRVLSYKDRGLYFEQIKRIYKYFRKDQVLFIKYESYLMQQEQYVKNIIEFLGLDIADLNFVKKEVHKIKYNNLINISERNYLFNFFANDIEKVERILNWDCSDWKI